MKLSGKFSILSKYNGKSKFSFWGNLKPGDVIEVSVVLKSEVGGRNGMYSPTIKIECDGKKFSCGFNEAANYLSKIELTEYKPKIQEREGDGLSGFLGYPIGS